MKTPRLRHRFIAWLVAVAAAFAAIASGAGGAMAATAALPFAPPYYAGVFGQTVVQNSGTGTDLTVWNDETGRTTRPLDCGTLSPTASGYGVSRGMVVWQDSVVQFAGVLYAMVTADSVQLRPNEHGLCEAVIEAARRTDPSESTLDDGGVDVIIESHDLGLMWSVSGIPAALRASRVPPVLASTPFGVAFGNPNVGWDHYNPTSHDWTGPADSGLTYGLHEYRVDGQRTWELDQGRTTAEVSRPLTGGTVWNWKQAKGRERFTYTRDGQTVKQRRLPIPTVHVPEASNVYRVAPLCSWGPRNVPVRGLEEVVPSSDGHVLWALTGATSTDRCDAPREFMHIEGRSTLVTSTNGGTSWRAVRTPIAPTAIVTVDGTTPVLQTGRACAPDNETVVLRRSGAGWRRIACEPSQDN